MANIKHWIKILYGPWFKLFGFFYRTYKANRQRITALKQRRYVADVAKTAMVLTLVVWLVIWLFASEESRQQLTEAVKAGFQSRDAVGEK